MVTALTLGANHSFAVLSDGTVRGWGKNADGCLGLGKAKGPVVPVKVPDLSEVKQIATGLSHSCALFLDGKVMCWGSNFGGALGNGTTKASANPTPVKDIQAVEEVRVGGRHSCVRLTGGEARCWGLIVSGVRSLPELVSSLRPVAGLSLGGDHSCAWESSGAMACWDLAIGLDFDYGAAEAGGDGNIKPVSVVKSVSNAKEVSVSETHACVLHSDATVSCWGYGHHGELGDGAFGEKHVRPTPTRVPELGDVAQIAVGEGYSCARKTDGSVLCWGKNTWGQLGVGDKKRRTKPESVAKLEKIKRIALGGSHACALGHDSKVLCWGKNIDGQLGNGKHGIKATELKPVRVTGL